MYELTAFTALFIACFFWVRTLRIESKVEAIQTGFLVLAAHIIAGGYILSALQQLGSLPHWALFSGVAALLSAGVGHWYGRNILNLHFSTHTIRQQWQTFYRELSRFEKLALSPLAFTFITLQILNLLVIFLGHPNTWDSMTYHLARVAYYLQHNSLAFYEANYWAQVVHPKNSAILLLFTYLVSGHNEHATQLVQYIAYLISVLTVFAISKKVGQNAGRSLFAALLSGLITEWLLQSTTTQNDMLLTAFIGVALYFLFAFRSTLHYRYLALSALSMGLAVGTKSSAFMAGTPVAAITIYLLFSVKDNLQFKLTRFAFFSASVLIAIVAFALPAGYLENYRLYGHPIAPTYVREMHSFSGDSPSYVFVNGTKNIIRFGFEFLSLDGLPPIELVQNTQTLLRKVPATIFTLLDIDLYTHEANYGFFGYNKIPSTNEDSSYWGVFGFTFGWLAALLTLLGIIKSNDFKALSAAAIIFLLAQAFIGPFDPWRGRYFTVAALLLFPITGFWLGIKSPLVRGYVLTIVLIGCLSAVTTVLFRTHTPLISNDFSGYPEKSIFLLNRFEQITNSVPDYYEPLHNFEKEVPANATVAIMLNEDAPEYPLFGQDLTRTILPIHSFLHGLQPIPPNAQYLLMVESSPCLNPKTDLKLGAGWYLRKLHENNRQCP